MRGKSWSIEEERQLRELVTKGLSVSEIAQIMRKSALSVKGKVFNSGLNSVVVATGVPNSVATTIATTTSTAPVSPAASDSGSIDAPASVSVRVEGVELKLPEQLPSLEYELKILSAAIDALRQPGLSRAECSRLHKIILAVKIYQELFPKFVRYASLEAELAEVRRELASDKERKKRDFSSNL